MENWLTKRVKLSGNELALVFEEKQWTFKELYDEVRLKAGKLQNLGIRENDRVALLGGNTIAMYQMILTLQQLGVEIVFLNHRLSSEELSYQIQDSGVDNILFEREFQEKILQVSLTKTQQAFSFEKVFEQEYIEPTIISTFEKNKVTSIMYTSGTTGNPKGVLQTFNNHWSSAIGSMLNLGLSETDSWVLAVPLFHISGFSMMMKSLIYGVPIYLFEKFDADKINELLISGKGGNISVVSTMLKALIADLGERSYHKNLHCVLLGGGPIDELTLEICLNKNIPVNQSYGMTETASQVVALNQKDAKRKLGSAGLPLFPVQIRTAVDDIEQPSKQLGEIQLQAPNITKGYLNLTEKFAQEWTHDGWFKTGDMGYLDEEGYLFVVSRMSEMIISGGENIFPTEVENVIARFPGIKESAVVGKADEKWGQVPVVFLVCASQQTFDIQELQQFIAEKIAHYKVPKEFYFLEELPRNATGKLLRRKLVIPK